MMRYQRNAEHALKTILGQIGITELLRNPEAMARKWNRQEHLYQINGNKHKEPQREEDELVASDLYQILLCFLSSEFGDGDPWTQRF